MLIYEGHDMPRAVGQPDPKLVDQPLTTPTGDSTQNGLFCEAAMRYRRNEGDAELVKVYEKIRPGIWVYNGLFRLVDAWQETSGGRRVLKFRLEMVDSSKPPRSEPASLDRNRVIPTHVKLEVWKRDRGKCVICGSKDNLHFDHIIPYSRGGSSLVTENIQLLCARHNIAKMDKIE